MNDDESFRRGKHLSVSQLTTYLTCSWKYYLKYVLKWADPPKLHLANGKAGHAAVEFNQRFKIRTGEDQQLDRILDLFSDAYDAGVYEIDKADLDPTDDVGGMKDRTAEALKVYRHIDAPKQHPIATEVEFSLTIPPIEGFEDLPPVIGRIDYLMEEGMGDNKFPKTHRKKSQAEVDMSDQLSTYDAALQEKGIVVPTLGLKIFLPGNSKNTPDVQNLYRATNLMVPDVRQNRIERTFYKFRQAWAGIKAGIFIPTDNPIACGMCPFRERCQYNLIKSDYDALQIRNALE